MQKLLYDENVNKIGDKIKCNNKRFWTFVKQKKSTGSLPKQLKHNGIVYKTIKTIATAFNTYFESVFTLPIDDHNISFTDCPWRFVNNFSMPHISPESILRDIQGLSPNTATGADGISAIFLIKCADVICVPLADLFNMSLQSGEYPSILKLNNVIPIFKKGSKAYVENYRGISIEPIIAKLFESVVHRALRAHVGLLISPQQHGFMPGRSTASNLACYTEFISDAFDNKCQVHSIYTDYEKAFDVVPHTFLLLKMQRRFGIDGIYLKWFESYLKKRFQRVVMGGLETEWVQVTSGVPQGSILGPDLFIMFIDDLPNVLKHSECLLFADDAKIYKLIKCIADCILLQHDLNSMVAWCNTWNIRLNLKKCYYMDFTMLRARSINFSYSIKTTALEQIYQFKDLGVIFTPNLNFNLHICEVVGKSYRMLGFMRRILKPFNDISVYLSLYHTLIRSRLEYCSFIWNPSSQSMIDKIEGIQKKFLKMLSFKLRIRNENLPYNSVCEQFNFQSLKQRRNMLDLRNFNKLLNGKIDCNQLLSCVNFKVPITLRDTRNKPLFSCKCRLLVRKNSPIMRASYLANETKLDVLHCCPQSFKALAKAYFS